MNRESFLGFVLDQLRDFDEVSDRAMFGGHGLYWREVFFGIVYKSRLYLKTDETTQEQYVALGMKPFQPNAKQTLRSYYETPADVVENDEKLCQWARQAVACQQRAANS